MDFFVTTVYIEEDCYIHMDKAFLSVSISVDVCSQPQCFSHSNGVPYPFLSFLIFYFQEENLKAAKIGS
jgi:hypothetical protein